MELLHCGAGLQPELGIQILSQSPCSLSPIPITQFLLLKVIGLSSSGSQNTERLAFNMLNLSSQISDTQDAHIHENLEHKGTLAFNILNKSEDWQAVVMCSCPHRKLWCSKTRKNLFWLKIEAMSLL